MGKIIVSEISKAYKIYPTRWSRLKEWLSPSKETYHTLKWVMRNVSFSIESGQAVGIVGLNGAGKSTLLKIITGTTKPTTGNIHMSGRVAALLELGMGFHPEFTGRQNVYMSGQLLGLTFNEITQLMPDIEKFAEIGDYMDQPVRVYSSGMQMRVAFSIATAVRPDILIVDEALSVGDAYFQHKSFDRIRQFRKLGTTLLIVSHDKQAIQSICDRAILLNNGSIEMEGEPESVMDYYNALLSDEKAKENIVQSVDADGRRKTVSGSGEACVTDIKLLNKLDESVSSIAVGEEVSLCISVKVNKDIERLVLGFGIKDRVGQVLFGTNTWHTKQIIKDAKEGDLFSFNISFKANYGPGTYSVQTALVDSDTHYSANYEWKDLALVFEVTNVNKPFFVGTQWNDVDINICKEM
ncbi:ABC transporter ATP-binding protein [Vibrio cholerae]|uniref:ABC transporter ATP-binding protein n=1 Tax=Vibrio cholerae TaxID=666 RepID=UPI00372C66E5